MTLFPLETTVFQGELRIEKERVRMKKILKVAIVAAICLGILMLVLYIKDHPIKSIASYLVVDGIMRVVIRSRRIITLGIGLVVLIYFSKKLFRFLAKG